MNSTTAPALSTLDASEAQGITFSMVHPVHGEMGVASFPAANVDGARSSVLKTLELQNVGLVPRTQSAVDVMAEVLS